MTADGFLLDTNVVSELARTRIEPKVAGWISDQSFETLLISVITLGEMEKGFTTMQDPVKLILLAAWCCSRIRDYERIAAPEPEVLRVIGEESKRKGTDKLTPLERCAGVCGGAGVWDEAGVRVWAGAGGLK